jgi:hypothetical protein
VSVGGEIGDILPINTYKMDAQEEMEIKSVHHEMKFCDSCSLN